MNGEVFVGRSSQLHTLDAALAEMLEGRGGVRFVVGDAGSGKTALLLEYAQRAQRRHEDLVVAMGRSDAQTGVGDPYLPFRELLAQLTNEPDAQHPGGELGRENERRVRRLLGVSGEAIVEFGPDLIGALIPGAGLVTRAATFLLRKSGRLDTIEEMAAGETESANPAPRRVEQEHVFEQYTNVIRHMAQHQPLLLVLDDLQWSDAASIGLLFHLARSIGDGRVLVVGAYRPAEVATLRGDQRHPLDKVVAELKRTFGDISIDLNAIDANEKRRLVDRIVDTEPNDLSSSFRAALFDRTGGHPLFTVELLRALRERGDLVRDAAGRWMEPDALDWGAVPARVEGVIEERIGRLGDELLDTLIVASVEGEDFTAEVVAGAARARERVVVQQLGRELVRRHHLVRSRGIRRLDPPGVRLSLYSFEHNLFQRYLYGTLGDAERAYLHEDVGRAIEALCSDGDADFVVQLAHHYVEAGLSEKAAHYSGLAAVRSAAQHAHDETVQYASAALRLLPESATAARSELVALCEQAHRLMGARDEQAADLARLRALADRLDDDPRRAEAWIRQAAMANETGDFPAAIDAAQAAIQLVGVTRDPELEARAYMEFGKAVDEMGHPDEARAKFEHALALADGAGLHRIQARCLNSIGWIHLFRGEFEAAAANMHESVRIVRRLGDSSLEAKALNGLAVLHAMTGALDDARRYFEDSLARERRIGNRRASGRILSNLGHLALQRHDYVAAASNWREGLRISRLAGDRSTVAGALTGLGDVAMRFGRLAESRAHLEESVEIAEQTGERGEVCSAHLVLGELALREGDPRTGVAHARHAEVLAHESEIADLEVSALELLGRSEEAREDWREAASAYRRCLAAAAGYHNATIDPTAGLARVALAAGDVAAAVDLVESFIDDLDGHSLDNTSSPGRIYVTASCVLDAAGDARATSVIQAGRRWLRQMERRIEDPADRRDFLRGQPSHLTLLELAAAR